MRARRRGKILESVSTFSHLRFAVTAAMEIPDMQPNPAVTSMRVVHQRYRIFLRAGFTPRESAALTAFADGIARHAEGESPVASAWSWREISRLEFVGYLARSGRLGGPDDGRP